MSRTAASARRPRRRTLPLVGVTMGDPAGVGPELCLRLLRERRVLDCCVPVIFGSADVLARVSRAARIPFATRAVLAAGWPPPWNVTQPLVVDCGLPDPAHLRPREVQKRAGAAAAVCIRHAVRAAMAGEVSAVVTGPINKESLRRAGLPYPGHTEMLADLTGARDVRMMFADDGLLVALATIHVPYARVPQLLTRRGVLRTIRLAAEAARGAGRRAPRITVCGLNPHAGEHGLFGTEERDVIAPAVAAARRAGLRVTGPLPPDTAFVPAVRQRTDAYVALYHDQGLIPFKMLAFDRGVNVTLGLPIVRTSPDHGTAVDIAWKGTASPESMIRSVLLAVRMAHRSHRA